MDLELQNRAVWLLLGQTPAAWKLAETCLQEGACVALLSEECSGDRPADRTALAARFGLRLRIAAGDDRPSLLGPAPADLLLWGGRPAAIIALGTNATPHAHSGLDWAQLQRSCVTAIQSSGALVLVEPGRRCQGVEDLNLPALHETRRLWEALAPEGVRISVVGVPGHLFGPVESGTPGRCEEAVMDLILFLASRGFGSVAAVGADGAVQLC